MHRRPGPPRPGGFLIVTILAVSLTAIPGIRHRFFTRKGGVSKGQFASLNCGFSAGDELARVTENRARVCAKLSNHSKILLTTAQQVHGTDTATVSGAWEGNPLEADALVTATPGIALGVLTADCAPVLLADPYAGVIGGAHAGWRGALAGVTGAAVQAMVDLGADPGRMIAAIGPCISQESYEIGPEFPTPFLAEDPDNRRFFTRPGEDGRQWFDLGSYVTMRLKVDGVGAVESIGLDTCADDTRFFSYRRSVQAGGSNVGRQVSVIVLDQK